MLIRNYEYEYIMINLIFCCFGQPSVSYPCSCADILSQLDAQISSMMYKTDKAWHCGVCDRTSRGKINISRHIEATHLENHPGLNCDICGETVRTRNALRQHKSDRHRQKC